MHARKVRVNVIYVLKLLSVLLAKSISFLEVILYNTFIQLSGSVIKCFLNPTLIEPLICREWNGKLDTWICYQVNVNWSIASKNRRALPILCGFLFIYSCLCSWPVVCGACVGWIHECHQWVSFEGCSGSRKGLGVDKVPWQSCRLPESGRCFRGEDY